MTFPMESLAGSLLQLTPQPSIPRPIASSTHHLVARLLAALPALALALAQVLVRALALVALVVLAALEALEVTKSWVEVNPLPILLDPVSLLLCTSCHYRLTFLSFCEFFSEVNERCDPFLANSVVCFKTLAICISSLACWHMLA